MRLRAAPVAPRTAAGLTWVGEVVAGEPGVELSRAGSAVGLAGYEHPVGRR